MYAAAGGPEKSTQIAVRPSTRTAAARRPRAGRRWTGLVSGAADECVVGPPTR
jgi:hypothetical protein